MICAREPACLIRWLRVENAWVGKRTNIRESSGLEVFEVDRAARPALDALRTQSRFRNGARIVVDACESLLLNSVQPEGQVPVERQRLVVDLDRVFRFDISTCN